MLSVGFAQFYPMTLHYTCIFMNVPFINFLFIELKVFSEDKIHAVLWHTCVYTKLTFCLHHTCHTAVFTHQV